MEIMNTIRNIPSNVQDFVSINKYAALGAGAAVGSVASAALYASGAATAIATFLGGAAITTGIVTATPLVALIALGMYMDKPKPKMEGFGPDSLIVENLRIEESVADGIRSLFHSE